MSLETRQQEERDLGGREADGTLVVDLSDGALSALSLALPIERAVSCLRPAPQPVPRSGSLARYNFSRLCTAHQLPHRGHQRPRTYSSSFDTQPPSERSSITISCDPESMRIASPWPTLKTTT
jgi:hypothetical protein